MTASAGLPFEIAVRVRDDSPAESSRSANTGAIGIGQKVSCTECRRVKCKCIPSLLGESQPCQRCTRLKLSCLFQAHQRGRPRKDPETERPQHPPKKRIRNNSLSASPAVPSLSPHHQAFGTNGQVSSSRSGLSRLDGQNRTISADDTPQEEEGGSEEPETEPRELEAAASSVYHAVADRSSFSIAGVMDRSVAVPAAAGSSRSHAGPGAGPGVGPTMSYQDDPVSCGILSLEEAESLFIHYHNQLQTCVCLLDAAVHDVEYTRQRSLQLFTAVLAVTSKFFRPELYEPILQIANRVVGQAIYDGLNAIELVQAICLLHYWKKPTDSSGWLRLGHAIRLAYQLDLHLPRKSNLSADERTARLQIDRERTWICEYALEWQLAGQRADRQALFCFDSTMTQLSDRPSMMHKAPDVESWIAKNPYPLPSDGQLDFAVNIFSSEIRQLQACKGSYEIMRSGLRRILDDLHQSHQALLSDQARLRLTSTSSSIVKFSALAIRLLVECTSFSISLRNRKNGLAHTCVSTSLEMLDIVIEDFAQKNVMPMIEDAHSVAVASTAVRLIRFLPYLDVSARSAVKKKLTKVVIVCREAARGDQESHPAYLARFVHALVEKSHLSRRPSRAQSPRQAITERATVPLSALSTTPDEWWENTGQYVYQQPVPPLEDQQGFWDGFPMLAGVMNAAPIIPMPEVFPTFNDGNGNGNTGVEEGNGMNWTDQWSFDMLGFSENA